MIKRVRTPPKEGIMGPHAQTFAYVDLLVELQSIGDLKWCKISCIHHRGISAEVEDTDLKAAFKSAPWGVVWSLVGY